MEYIAGGGGQSPQKKQFSSGPGRRCVCFYFEEAKHAGVKAFKGTIWKFQKVFAVDSLGLLDAIFSGPGRKSLWFYFEEAAKDGQLDTSQLSKWTNRTVSAVHF
jgi:hypothetical protein